MENHGRTNYEHRRNLPSELLARQVTGKRRYEYFSPCQFRGRRTPQRPGYIPIPDVNNVFYRLVCGFSDNRGFRRVTSRPSNGERKTNLERNKNREINERAIRSKYEISVFHSYYTTVVHNKVVLKKLPFNSCAPFCLPPLLY